METYKRSVLESNDVRNMVSYAREEGREEGREENTEKVIQKCLQKNIAIEDIVFLTGYSKEQVILYAQNHQ